MKPCIVLHQKKKKNSNLSCTRAKTIETMNFCFGVVYNLVVIQQSQTPTIRELFREQNRELRKACRSRIRRAKIIDCIPVVQLPKKNTLHYFNAIHIECRHAFIYRHSIDINNDLDGSCCAYALSIIDTNIFGYEDVYWS